MSSSMARIRFGKIRGKYFVLYVEKANVGRHLRVMRSLFMANAPLHWVTIRRLRTYLVHGAHGSYNCVNLLLGLHCVCSEAVINLRHIVKKVK